MRLAILLLTAALLGAEPAPAPALRDVTRLQGVRGNQLLGYGMVVGLEGTGDKDQTRFTTQSLANLMARQGLTVSPSTLKVKNVAAVMVTAELPPFARAGARLDVTVSSTGDAKSLVGGVLLMTPLQGPDGQAYAVAQGALLVGGGAKVHPTVGRVPEGALVERELGGDFNARATLRYSLLEEDFGAALRVAEAINAELGGKEAQCLDARTIELKIPAAFQGRAVELAARLERLPIALRPRARVVVNERTGTVILGADVRLGPVSLVQGGLTVRVGEEPPAPPAEGDAEKPKALRMESGATVGRLAELLNGLGVGPKDLVAVLQALKEAGSLQAELRIL